MSRRKHTKADRYWRIGVIRRDKICQCCGSRKNRQAHHLNCYSYFPDERTDIDNGITLCRSCHTQFHTNFKRSFKTKCTRYDFENFMSLYLYVTKKAYEINND